MMQESNKMQLVIVAQREIQGLMIDRIVGIVEMVGAHPDNQEILAEVIVVRRTIVLSKEEDRVLGEEEAIVVVIERAAIVAEMEEATVEGIEEVLVHVIKEEEDKMVQVEGEIEDAHFQKDLRAEEQVGIKCKKVRLVNLNKQEDYS